MVSRIIKYLLIFICSTCVAQRGRSVYPIETKTEIYLSQCTTPSAKYIAALCNLSRQLTIDATWGYLDRFWIFATEIQADARVSFVNPRSTQITELNTPTWKADSGYFGNNAGYLNSNYNMATSSVNYKRDTSCIGFYQLEQPPSNFPFGIFNNATGANATYINTVTTVFNGGMQSLAGQGQSYSGNKKAMISIIRYGGQISFYIRGSIFTGSPYTNADIALQNANMYILANNDIYNTSVDPAASANTAEACFYMGSSKMNQLTIYNDFQIFATAIGFNK